MLARIQVGLKPTIIDSFGDQTRNRIVSDLHLQADAVRTIKVFTVDAEISNEEPGGNGTRALL